MYQVYIISVMKKIPKAPAEAVRLGWAWTEANASFLTIWYYGLRFCLSSISDSIDFSDPP